MDEVNEMGVKERSDALINVKSFSICSCPISVIKDFKEFCNIESKNDYSLGLKILLERNKINFQQEVFAMKIRELEDKIIILEEAPKQEKKEEKKNVKTFGGTE